jgi:hypothetical protein
MRFLSDTFDKILASMPLEILMPLTFIFACAAGKDLKDFYEQIPIMILEWQL